MSRPPQIPVGAWPIEMTAEFAAGYVGEPSVESFNAKVKARVYSAPARGKGMLPKWHRTKLDSDVARRHGLVISGPIENIEDQI